MAEHLFSNKGEKSRRYVKLHLEEAEEVIRVRGDAFDVLDDDAYPELRSVRALADKIRDKYNNFASRGTIEGAINELIEQRRVHFYISKTNQRYLRLTPSSRIIDSIKAFTQVPVTLLKRPRLCFLDIPYGMAETISIYANDYFKRNDIRAYPIAPTLVMFIDIYPLDKGVRKKSLPGRVKQMVKSLGLTLEDLSIYGPLDEDIIVRDNTDDDTQE